MQDAGRFAWLDLVHAPVLVVEGEGRRVIRANASAVSLVGDQLDGRDLADLFGAYAAGRLHGLLTGPRLDTEEMVLYCRTPFGLATFGFKVARLPEGDGTVVTLRDHRESAAARRGRPLPAVDDFGAKLEDIVRSLPVGVEIYDVNMRELFFNAQSDQLFGLGAGDQTPAYGDFDGWWERAFPDDAIRAEVIREWRSCMDAVRADPRTVQDAEWEVLCRDGQTRTILFRFRFVGDTYVVVFWDVSEPRRLERELRHLAVTDELTGLCNRRRFFEEADRAFRIAVATSSDLSVLMMDLDHFKGINDSHGHAAGDAVLREVAGRCRAALRARDLVARMGGEEFAVLLPNTGAAGARLVAENLLEAMAGVPVTVGELALEVRCSIGCAALAADDRTIAAVIERADRGLYAAKAGGRDCVVMWAAETEEARDG